MIARMSYEGQRRRAWPGVRLGDYSGHIEGLVDSVLSSPGVAAVWVHGSRAIGTDHEASDVDLMVLARTPADRSPVVDELARTCSRDVNFPDYFTLTPQPYWSTPAGELGLRVMSPDQVQQQIDRLLESPLGLEEQQAFVQHVIVESFPLSDPENFVGGYQKRVSEIPDEFFRALSAKYLRLLDQKILWWDIRPRWKTVFERLSDMAVIVEELSRLHYAVNRCLFMPGMKEYERDLTTLEPDLGELLLSAAVLGTGRSDDELRQLVRHSVRMLRGRIIEPEEGNR